MTAYLRPTDDAHAIALRAAHADYLVLAGGTDLLVAAHHKPVPVRILDIAGRFAGITVDAAGVRIGAGTSWRAIATSAELAATWPILPAAAREVGALQMQTPGTIGGNLATSSPVGDGLPVLLALDATIHLASVRGARTVPYHQFCTGYRTTALGADELITAVTVPRPAPGTYLGWRKVGTRAAQSISKVMAACALEIVDGRIATARFGVGAVAARPTRAAADQWLAAALAETRPDDKITYVAARVNADATGPFVRRSVLVNAGREQGLSKGQAVVDERGLLGRVITAGQRSARVLLLTDLNSRVPVLVEGSNLKAIMVGDNSGQPLLEYLPPGLPAVHVSGGRD